MSKTSKFYKILKIHRRSSAVTWLSSVGSVPAGRLGGWKTDGVRYFQISHNLQLLTFLLCLPCRCSPFTYVFPIFDSNGRRSLKDVPRGTAFWRPLRKYAVNTAVAVMTYTHCATSFSSTNDHKLWSSPSICKTGLHVYVSVYDSNTRVNGKFTALSCVSLEQRPSPASLRSQ